MTENSCEFFARTNGKLKIFVPLLLADFLPRNSQTFRSLFKVEGSQNMFPVQYTPSGPIHNYYIIKRTVERRSSVTQSIKKYRPETQIFMAFGGAFKATTVKILCCDTSYVENTEIFIYDKQMR